ncbi:MAG: VWA domain-containing protein [Nitrospirota bacterium]|nr:VWA domain-containing protein [Nitrospirota bacterium]
MNIRQHITALVAAAMLLGCTSSAPGRGVYMLLDTSGTYTEHLNKAQSVVNYLLGNLTSGDSFAVARIDSGSFSEKDILMRATFDARPSVANDQKRSFKKTIDTFAGSARGASHTDITGGLLQAVEWLNEVGPGQKTVLIFSDMDEDLQKGQIRDFPLDLRGFHVVALNVTKLNKDNVDPRIYLDRLEHWKKRVEEGGGTWQVINDLERLDAIIQDT